MATVSPPWAYALHLPQDPRAPGVARSTLRTVLARHGVGGGAVAEAAELLASELVTNAHLYSDGPYCLRLRGLGGNRLRISVWDGNPHIPAPFRRGQVDAPPLTAESGRGLLLVQEYAESWGAYPFTDAVFRRSGKLLWVECGRS
ncbi:ATP-binding protein [Streptomyces sp. GC420]|uniref:ATP-binding protein n=1 Tax=Streptomyces sp. GC420 TaxID=2697568 RepID=UPI0014152F5A|nr:ATP-binding protein [Streptomyces sp. GC420]NBM17341.1 ATP-binding protein [Streptomyces sp. GC420]